MNGNSIGDGRHRHCLGFGAQLVWRAAAGGHGALRHEAHHSRAMRFPSLQRILRILLEMRLPCSRHIPQRNGSNDALRKLKRILCSPLRDIHRQYPRGGFMAYAHPAYAGLGHRVVAASMRHWHPVASPSSDDISY